MLRPRTRLFTSGFWPLGLLLPFGLVLSQNLNAQASARRDPSQRTTLSKSAPSSITEQSKFKGIFEPVNYSQDLNLRDVFFVNSEEGWVSGQNGTILHTTNGGKSWTTQLGGDPQSQGPNLKRLFFLDRNHGWAQDWDVLLGTTDGENWQQVGNDVRGDVSFVSPLRGFRSYGDIYMTSDGGATWKKVFTCATQAVVQGLTKQIHCSVRTIQFTSPLVGYGVGESNAPGGGLVVKTEDGGESWRAIFVPPESGDQRTNVVFFLNDHSGFAFRNTGMYRTTDGGGSWQGVPASLPRNDSPLKFADPEVGWALAQLPASGTSRVTYTSDGGAHWLARDLHFPALINGFSLPRRDRAYVVGEHGMIYRYRVVRADYTVANMIPAPLMPGLDSPVFSEVATLNDVVAKLRAKLPSPGNGFQSTGGPSIGAAAGVPGATDLPSSSGTPGSATVGSPPASTTNTGAASAGSFQQDTTGAAANGAVPGSTPVGVGASGFQQNAGTGPVAGGYMDSCCGQLMQQLETTANSFATNIPAFSQHFRNLNLILEGLNLVSSIVVQANTLKQSVRTLRQAKNAQAAAAAFSTVQTQVNGISSSGFVQDTTMPPQP